MTTVEKARLSAERQIRELSNQHPGIKRGEDILKATARKLRERHQQRTFAGKVGSFTGAMAATLTDPLVIGTIPFGASTSAGILKTALIEAGYGMVWEIARGAKELLAEMGEDAKAGDIIMSRMLRGSVTRRDSKRFPLWPARRLR